MSIDPHHNWEQCDQCGNFSPPDDMQWTVGLEKICSACKRDMEICEVCLRVGERDEMTEVDGLWLCPECVTESKKAE